MVGAGATSPIKTSRMERRLEVDNGMARGNGSRVAAEGGSRGSAIMKSCRHFRTRAPSPSTFLRVIELSNAEPRVGIIEAGAG